MSNSSQWSPSSSQSSSTQVVSGSVTVPHGHVIVAEAWRGTQIVEALAETVAVLFLGDLGVVDFRTSEDTAVLFISEADLLAGSGYKRRIARFRHHNKAGLRLIVLVHTTPLTAQQFSALQSWVTVDLGFTTLSVSTPSEAGRLLARLAVSHLKNKVNPFHGAPQQQPPQQQLLATVGHMPGLGPKRVQQVLTACGSLNALAKASPQQLGEALGNAGAAQTLYNFMHEDDRS